jgi:hypothetical protein
MYTPNTQIHDRSLSCLGKGTSIKSGGVIRHKYDENIRAQGHVFRISNFFICMSLLYSDLTEILLKVTLNITTLILSILLNKKGLAPLHTE